MLTRYFVVGRSGLAHKKFIDVGAGVVDADYRGNVGGETTHSTNSVQPSTAGPGQTDQKQKLTSTSQDGAQRKK